MARIHFAEKDMDTIPLVQGNCQPCFMVTETCRETGTYLSAPFINPALKFLNEHGNMVRSSEEALPHSIPGG